MFTFKFIFGNDVRRVGVDKTLSVEEVRELAKSLFRDSLPQNFTLKYKDDEGDVVTISSDRELEEAVRVFKDPSILRILIGAAPTTNASSNTTNTKSTGTDEKNFFEDLLSNLPADIKAVSSKVEEGFQQFMPKFEEQVQDLLPKLEETFESIFGSLKEEKPKGEKPREEPKNNFVHPAICDNCSNGIVGDRWKCTQCPDYDLCDGCKKFGNIHTEHVFQKMVRSDYRCPYRARCPRRTQSAEIPREKPQESIPKDNSAPQSPIAVAKPVEEVKPVIEEIKPVEQPKVETAPVEIVVPSKPIVEEKPIAKSREISPFEAKLKQLEEMGFMDRAKNVELLVKERGDMISVVKSLLE